MSQLIIHFPSIVQGLNSVKDGLGNYGNQSSGNPYEILSDEEKNKLEKIYEEESELRKIEIEKTEQTRNLDFGFDNCWNNWRPCNWSGFVG